MKKIYLLIFGLFLIPGLNAQVVKTVENTAGNLKALLSETELSSVTDLTITGSMDARDFYTIRIWMSSITRLDISEVSVVAFSGTDPTLAKTDYEANVIPDRALQWKRNLTTLLLPSSITAIDVGAFWGCEALSSVTVPSSVTSIGDAAFMECSSLTTISIPSTLTTIGVQAFDGCTSLTSLAIPSSVTYIGNNAFRNCSSITAMVIPSSVTVIEKGTFSECSKLNAVILPSTITSIDKNAFFRCSALTSIELPSGITAISDYCFSGCTALTAVGLPSTIVSIGIDAFSDCTSLGSITIPSSVTSIGNKAFSGCSALKDIILPTALKALEPGVFYGCSALTSITIPASVISIGDEAFAFCYNLASVVIPSSVNFIGSNAFEGCTNIKNIWSYRSTPVPLNGTTFSSVDKSTCTLHVPFGSEAYYASADEWKDFNLVSDTTGFGISANSLRIEVDGGEFQITVNATSAWQASSDQPWVTVSPSSGNANGTVIVTAGANNSSIFRFARITFTPGQGDPQVISVTQKSTPAVIPITAGNLQNALTPAEMDTITSLTMTGTINVNDIDAINAGFPRLTYLDLSNTKMTSTVAYYGYYPDNWWPGPSIWKNSGNIGGLYKPSLKTLKLPSTVEVLGSGAFSGSGITTLVIPSSVSTIGWSAFAFCPSLETITIPATVKDINQWVFDACTALKEVNIEAPFTTIPRGTFASCSALASVTIPNTVRSIQMSAFYGCSSLTTLDLPATLADIENAAFLGCTGLTIINSYNPIPPSLGGGDFEEVYATCQLNVPYGSAALYAVAEGWKEFKNIVENLPGFSPSVSVVSIKGAQESTATATILSNIDWIASSDQSWLTVSPSSGTSTQQLTFTAEANPSPYGRSAKVTFSSAGLESRTVTVIQEGSPKTLNLMAGTLNSVLTEDELMGITHLTLSGEIDARDFEIMTISMPLLTVVDLRKTTIKAWSGEKDNAIPQGAFKNKSTLTDLQLPESVNMIGSGSFANCTGLTTIRLPQTVTIIEYDAFSNCINLDTIYSYNPIPPEGTIKNVNRNNCVLMVPYGAKELYMHSYGWMDFKNIVEMHGFKLSASMLAVKADAGSSVAVKVSSDVEWSAQTDQPWMLINPFTGTGTHMVTFTAEANPAAYGRLGSVTFSSPGTGPQTITIIQEGQPKTIHLVAGTLSNVLTAQELEGITNLTITGEMDARDFRTMRDHMPMLTGIDISGATIKAYRGPDGTALTYYSQMPYAANEIPLYAFYNDSTLIGKKTLTSVYLPQTVIRIGQSAFNHCSGLTTIKIPSSVLKMDDYAFANCYYLDSIYSFAVNPPELGYYSSFYYINTTNCQLYVTYGSARLYKNELFWQDFIHLVEMPGFSLSDKTIAVDNKENSTGTTHIDANVTWTAGSDQKWLEVSPTTETGIKDLSFTAAANTSELGRMATVTITAPGIEPQTITLIQNGQHKTVNLTAGGLSTVLTKEELTGITSLILAGEIDARDFRTMRDNMPLLTSIDMSKTTITGYTGMDGTFEGNDIGYAQNTIPFYAFFSPFDYKGKSSLTSVILPDSVKCINENAFAGCTGLNAAIIPSSVKEILGKAFYNCSKLTAVYAYPLKPPFLNYPLVFGGIDKNKCTLYVPVVSKSLYAAANQWKDFAQIVEMTGIELSATALSMEAIPNTCSIKITTASAWTAICDKDWLSVSPESGDGQKEITLTANANETNMERVAIVTVSAPEAEARTITVTQHGLVTGVDKLASPMTITCYPNPFTSEMSIEIANPSLREVLVEIYSFNGQKVKTLLRAQKAAKISCSWNGRNESGNQLPGGMYLLKVNGETRKVVKR